MEDRVQIVCKGCAVIANQFMLDIRAKLFLNRAGFKGGALRIDKIKSCWIKRMKEWRYKEGIMHNGNKRSEEIRERIQYEKDK